MQRLPQTIAYSGGDMGWHTQRSPDRFRLHHPHQGNKTTSLFFSLSILQLESMIWAMAHPFQLITVRYPFNIQSEGSPMPKQLKR